MARDLPQPDICTAGQFRLKGALAAGTAIAAATNYREVVNVRGAARGRIWIKTATAGGTLKASAIESVTTDDANPRLDSGAINPAKVTAITDGAPSDVTVTAGTTTHMDLTFNGESYILVTLAGGGTGTISFVEIALL